MNIYEKRPLALILSIGLGGFYLFSIGSNLLRAILISISILPLIIFPLLRKINVNKFLLKASCAVLLVSFILSFLYFDLYFNLDENYDDEVEIVGVVEGITKSSYNKRLEIKTESINGKKANFRVFAYPTAKEASGIIEGTRLCFIASLGGFSEESKLYNISNGISAYANDISDIQIIEYTKGGITGFFGNLRERLSRYVTLFSDSESGALVSALLLGERDLLPDKLRLDFKRIGISHILALSGLHLAILSLGVGKLLSLLKVKKKTRLVIIILFILAYMALTGFSVSVCRAGIMIIISNVLFLLGRTKDSLTSLTIAVVIICIFTPYAIFDISLWLSALATFGIIAFGEYFADREKPTEIGKKIKDYILLGILTSVFAISATMLISCICFGGISIIAPFATLIFSLICEIVMYLGCITMLIGWLIPIGFTIYPFTRLLYFLSSALSKIEFAYVSSSFNLVTVLISIYTALFFIFVVFKLNHKRTLFKLLMILFVVVMILPTVLSIKENEKETVAYSGGSKTDIILVRNENESCLINSSTYSKNTAYKALDLLEEANITKLNKYYLTHYSWSLDEDIETLIYNVWVDEIFIPAPRNEDEESILKILYKSCEGSNARIVTYQEYETVKVGDYSINLIYSEPYGNTSVNALAIAKRDTVYTYISSGILGGKLDEDIRKYMSLSDYIIFGDHGKKNKSKIYLDDCYSDLDRMIIHCENIFLRQNNMRYFIDNGCEILSHPKETVYFTNN